MSSRVSKSGGSPRNGASRSSGGHHGIPSAAYTDSSSGAAGSSPRPSTYGRAPVATTSSVPNRAGSAATSSTGTPSTVTPTARRSSRSSTDTIEGSASNVSSTGRGSTAEQTTAKSNEASAQRRGSPATSPPSAVAISSSRARALFSVRPFCGCGLPSRSRAASSRCSVCGPMPGTDVSRPARAAVLNSSAVEISSARPISTIRFGVTPRKRPSPTSSGCTSRSSSSSSAIVPVSTSSRRRPAMPGPIPLSSWMRSAATSSAIGACVERIVSAARRYARDV